MAPDIQSLCMGCMRTRAGSKCTVCGFVEGTQSYSSQQLPPRTMLRDRYLLGKVLGQGGFGITYLAWDTLINAKLAIKEYFPTQIATRADNRTTVVSSSQEAEPDFNLGLERFTTEASTLKRFKNHPNIVTVLNDFRANGTAYLVMEYVEGSTLASYLKTHEGKVSFDTALKFLLPVMDGLEAVHAAGVLHRDISPDNIYISNSGPVKILDFGSTRNALANKGRSQQVFLKPGFTPLEQYSTVGNQGVWTDEYALAATFYRSITGKTPPEATARVPKDPLAAPSRLGAAIPSRSEAALLKALQVHYEQRFPSIAEFRKALVPEATPPPPPPPPPPQAVRSSLAAPFLVFWVSGGVLLFAASIPRHTDWRVFGPAILLFLIAYLVLAGACRNAWAAIQDGQVRLSPGKVRSLLFVPFFGVFEVVRGFPESFNAFAARRPRSAPQLKPDLFVTFPMLVTMLFLAMLTSAFDLLWNPILIGAMVIASSVTGGLVIGRISDAVSALPTSPPREPSIRALSGEFAGSEFPINPNPLVIGRNPRAGVNLVLSSTMVSRVHVHVGYERPGAGVWIEDQGSTDGTYYRLPSENGRTSNWVRVHGRQLLRGGTQFRVSTDPEVFEVCDV
jgi:serine/threonine protein kinase